MHAQLLNGLIVGIKAFGKFDENDLAEAFKFSKTIREFVKEPSPTIVLLNMFISNMMEHKGNIYAATPINLSLIHI